MNENRWMSILIAGVLFVSLINPISVNAQSILPTFSSTITYQNIGSEVAHITLLVYPDGESTPITISRPDLAKGASATVSVGSLGNGSGFRGSAVVKSDVPLAILTTQVPTNSTLKIRPMTAGFSSGSPDVWFLYVNRNTTVLSVQNLLKVPSNFKLTFYGSASPITITKTNIPAGGSLYFPVASATELPSTFSGVVHVESTTVAIPLAGKIAGTQLNVNADGSLGHSTEAVTQMSTKLFMPVAMCNTTGAISSNYYVFNPDPTQSTAVTVSYNSGKSETKTLPPLSRALFNACSPTNTTQGYSGSAKITSTPGSVMAFGYIKGNILAGSFTGQAFGSHRLALPFANYSTSFYSNGQRHRTVISVMNLGSSLAAGTVKVLYYDKTGKLSGTHTLGALASGAKVDSTAALAKAGAEFGYYSDGSSGGSAIVQGPAGANMMAVAFIKTTIATGKFSGELYNAIVE